jgi:hypothetical protein
MFRVLVYIGNTIHNDETVECIEYAWHDATKMTKFLTSTIDKMQKEGKYFNFIIDEIKLEEKLEEQKIKKRLDIK